MTFVRRQTVASELFSELEVLFRQDAVPDNFTLARLERQAAALQQADAADASMVRAGIAALRWDTDKVDYWIKNALLLDNSIPNIENAALNWRQVVRMDKANELLLQCYEAAPRDTDVVNNAIESLGWNGQFIRAAEVIRKAVLDGIKLDADGLDPTGYLQDMQELDIDPNRIEFEIQSAYRVLANNCRRMQAFRIQTYTDHDGDSSIVVQLAFYGTLDDELRFESQLAELLSDEPGWNPCRLTTELQYMEAHVFEPA